MNCLTPPTQDHESLIRLVAPPQDGFLPFVIISAKSYNNDNDRHDDDEGGVFEE